MAVFDLFGTSENDPGTWFDFGKRATFQVKVRRIPLDKIKEIERRYEGKETYEITNGFRRRVRDVSSMMDSIQDSALWAWVDLKGFVVTPRDEAGAKLLGLTAAEIGQEVEVTGKVLTGSMKKAILDKIRPLAVVDEKVLDKDGNETGAVEETTKDFGSFIVDCVKKLNDRQSQIEAEAQSNS